MRGKLETRPSALREQHGGGMAVDTQDDSATRAPNGAADHASSGFPMMIRHRSSVLRYASSSSAHGTGAGTAITVGVVAGVLTGTPPPKPNTNNTISVTTRVTISMSILRAALYQPGQDSAR